MSLLDKAKAAAKSVGEKAQEGVKAGQEKLEVVKTRKQIDSWKEEIGGIVYAQRTGAGAENAEAEISRLVGDIQEAERHLEEVDEG